MSDQWGVPQPPKAGYVAEPFGAAYAGAPYGGTGLWRTNGIALVGAILSVLPPIGLVLSVIGLGKARTLGGAGHTTAIVGIVLSLVFAGGYGFGFYELAGSTGANPACSSMLAAESSLSVDESGLTAGDSTSGGGGGSGRAVLSTTVAQLRVLKVELDRDVVRATHADVRGRIRAVDVDLGQMIADAEAVQSGDDAALSGLETAAGRLQADAAAVDRLCGDVGGQQGE